MPEYFKTNDYLVLGAGKVGPQVLIAHTVALARFLAFARALFVPSLNQ